MGVFYKQMSVTVGKNMKIMGVWKNIYKQMMAGALPTLRKKENSGDETCKQLKPSTREINMAWQSIGRNHNTTIHKKGCRIQYNERLEGKIMVETPQFDGKRD